MRTTKWLGGGSLAIALVLLLAVNMFSAEVFTGARLDLTANNVYTLSEGTHNLLDRLDEPVTLRLFLSQDLVNELPSIASYARRVRDLLAEYEREAGGNLRVEVIDPEPFSEAEDRAVAQGLSGVPLGDGESNFYFGLVASGPTGEQAKIGFFSPDRKTFVEYDITKLIHQVAWPEKRVIGLLSGVDMTGTQNPRAAQLGQGGGQPWVILEQMRQLFEVNELEQAVNRIPAEVDVLMLVQPGQLSAEALYAVDQFVLRGGRVLAFVDPQSTGSRPRRGAGGAAKLADQLLAKWGIDFDRKQVVADLQLAEQVRYQDGQRTAVSPYPVWLSVPAEQMSDEDVVTANVGSLMFATAGHLQPQADKNKELTITPLVQTTAKAGLVASRELGPFSNPEQLMRRFQPGDSPKNLVVRVNGPLQTAFPDGPPATDAAKASDAGNSDAGDNGEEATAAGATGSDPGNPDPQTDKPVRQHLSASAEPANLLIVGDSDMLRDRFWVQVQNLLGNRIAVPSHANGSLVVNALDNLTGDNDLISVRNRGQFERPFTKLDELRQQAELRYREKEQQLLNELRSTEQRLAELEQGKGQQQGNEVILSEEQEKELARFRDRQVEIRKELRRVRHQLRKDIENLKTGLIFLNTALVPILIALGGLFLALKRRKRRLQATQT